MSINFPTTLDTVTQLPTEAAGTALAVNHVTSHQNLAAAIIALETKIGVNASAVTTTHDYKLSGITGSDKAVSLAGAEVVTNKTLGTGTKVLLGSDATGDIYYNGGSGVLTRLAVSTDGKILKLAGGIPSWVTETVTNDASTTVKGIVEIATDAEVNAGTATGSTGAILVIPATSAGAVGAGKIVQFTAATKYPAADGSLITNLSGVTKKIYSDATYLNNQTASPVTAYTQNIIANTFAIGNTIHIYVNWAYTGAGGNTSVMSVKYGGTTIYTETIGASSSAVTNIYMAIVSNTTANITAETSSVFKSAVPPSSALTIPNVTSDQTFLIEVTGITGTGGTYYNSFMVMI